MSREENYIGDDTWTPEDWQSNYWQGDWSYEGDEYDDVAGQYYDEWPDEYWSEEYWPDDACPQQPSSEVAGTEDQDPNKDQSPNVNYKEEPWHRMHSLRFKMA